MSGDKPVTIKKLAAHLELAHSTVSRALGDHANISTETKERVKKAARDLGYIANSGARFMRTGHSSIIGLVVPDITNEFYSSVAKILAEECSERGRPLVLSVSEDDPQRELALIQALLESRPAGLVVTLTSNPRKETIAHLNRLPVVQVLRFDRRLTGHTVTIDDRLGGYLATEYLAELGHTRIGFLGVPQSLSTGAARLRGFQAAMAERRLLMKPEWQSLVAPGADSAAHAFLEMITSPNPPQAVFVASPQQAVGVARVVQDKKIKIPADLSLVAYGNSTWFTFFAGGLSSVSLPLHELATTASSLLFRDVKQPARDTSPSSTVALAPILVKRNSAIAPRG